MALNNLAKEGQRSRNREYKKKRRMKLNSDPESRRKMLEKEKGTIYVILKK